MEKKSIRKTIVTVAVVLGMVSVALPGFAAEDPKDFYPATFCSAFYATSQNNVWRNWAGEVFNVKSASMSFVCPMWFTEHDEYYSFSVFTVDSHPSESVTCRVVSCDDAGACYYSAVGSTGNAATGNVTLTWDENLDGSNKTILYTLPARHTSGNSGIRSYRGKR